MKCVPLVLVLGLYFAGCAARVLPSRPIVPAPTVIAYTINVPSGVIANQLNGQYPNGVTLSPIEAQRQFDFTSIYHVPNVYWGVQAPPDGTYAWTGIVVAPLAAASKAQFTSADWPGICAGSCSWLGRFAYARPAQ